MRAQILTADQWVMLEAARAISSGAAWQALELLTTQLGQSPALAGGAELRELARAVREPRSEHEVYKVGSGQRGS